MRNIYVIIIAFFLLTSCQSKPKHPLRAELTYKLGEIFKLDNIVDTSGRQVTLDLSASDISIIDIWNTACPPCVAEMKKFPDLIKGKKPTITVFSISVDQFWKWKPLAVNHAGVFASFDNNMPNWKQYNLMTSDNPGFKNILAVDRLIELDTVYHVTGNPAYFVLDKTGKILARPSSAVEYLQDLQ